MLGGLSADALRLALAQVDGAVLGAALDGLDRSTVAATVAGVCAGADGAELVGHIDAFVTVLSERVLGGTVADLAVNDSVVALQRLEGRVAAEKLRRVHEVMERDSHRLQGCRSVEDLLQRAGLTRGEACEQRRIAVALVHLPETRRQIAAGERSIGQAAAAARAWEAMRAADAAAERDAAEQAAAAAAATAAGETGTGDVGGDRDSDDVGAGGGSGAGGEGWGTDAGGSGAEDAGDDGGAGEGGDGDAGAAAAGVTAEQRAAELDERITAAGETLDRNALRRELDDWIATDHDDTLARREQRAHRNRRLHTWKDDLGQGRIDARGGAVGHAAIVALLDALCRPTDAADARTFEQRRYDALVGVADRYLAEGALPDVAAQQAHVILTTTTDALHGRGGAGATDGGVEAGPEVDAIHLDGWGAVSNATAQMICCDAEVTVIPVDGEGQPLNAGRTRRTPTRAQRRAVVGRDRACIGCHAPIARCQIHHIRWWRDGGATDIANLVLVCWNCHFHLHHHGWTVTRSPDGSYRAGAGDRGDPGRTRDATEPGGAALRHERPPHSGHAGRHERPPNRAGLGARQPR